MLIHVGNTKHSWGFWLHNHGRVNSGMLGLNMLNTLFTISLNLTRDCFLSWPHQPPRGKNVFFYVSFTDKVLFRNDFSSMQISVTETTEVLSGHHIDVGQTCSCLDFGRLDKAHVREIHSLRSTDFTDPLPLLIWPGGLRWQSDIWDVKWGVWKECRKKKSFLRFASAGGGCRQLWDGERHSHVR